MMFPNYHETIICASKYFSAEEIKHFYKLGYRDFGENRVNDFLAKKSLLRDLDVSWHFIGHLQTNKVKKVINEIDYLHTLDSLHLAEAIQTLRNTPLSCFIQLNLTEEPQKSGVLLSNLGHFMNEMKKYDKIKPVGFMTMGKLDDTVETERVFILLDELANQYHLPFKSMGMSDDYELAIKHHTTHLRIGRKFKELL